MKKLFLFVFLVSVLGVFGQKTRSTKFEINKVSIVNPADSASSFAVSIKSLEAPVPDGNHSKSHLFEQKKLASKNFPRKNQRSSTLNFGTAPNFNVVKGIPTTRYFAPLDKEYLYEGGTPLDNTMAFAGDYLMVSVNSFLWAYDIAQDTILFKEPNGSSKIITFAEFGKDYIVDPATEFPFDPKLLYVDQWDRFIFVFLSGRTPSDSKIIVGFSSTNNPKDPWNVYMLPGNPRNNDTWSDFPMIGYDNKNFYLSLNLLKEGETWQAGFRGSVVWEVPLNQGFNAITPITPVLHDNITYNGSYIRNLTPVQKGYGVKNEGGMLFLSNRNFDIQNDSIFTFQLSPSGDSTVGVVDYLQLPTPYGMPPNGLQADDNPNDHTDGLQTNDARFLGAIKYLTAQKEPIIEFVGNTMSFDNGRAGIYHGTIKNAETLASSNITGNIITVDSLDFGYPNITYVNNGNGCYEGTIIAFNHTSKTTPAGVSGVYHSDFEGYSELIRLKEGDNYVARLQGSYERWGDYFGLQTDPNNAGRVFSTGFYGTVNKRSSSWISEIFSPDSIPNFSVQSTHNVTDTNRCFLDLSLNTSGGFSPYTYLWNTGDTTQNVTVEGCENSAYQVHIMDQRGCETNFEATGWELLKVAPNSLYPNPVSDIFGITFSVSQKTTVKVIIYDMSGKEITLTKNYAVQKGENLLEFTSAPLARGTYRLIVYNSNEEIIIQKPFVKL